MNTNQRNAWIAVVIIVILIIIGVVVWRSRSTTVGNNASSTPAGTSMVLPYGSVTLGLGQQASFPGITIRPITLAEDSRCAAGVQCIQAGTVRVVVESTFDAGGTQQNTITLGSTTPVGNFSVGLTSVSPAAQASQKIADKDYRFTFDVHQSASGAGLQGKG